MTSPLIDDQVARSDMQAHDEARGSTSAHIAKLSDQPSVHNGEHDVPLHEQARPDTINLDEQSPETVSVHDIPTSDITRGGAEGRDNYTLSVEQIMQRLDVEGVYKSKRTVQKYLHRGEIDGQLVSMANGKKWLANELDLARFIEELKRKEALALYTQPDRETVSTATLIEQATMTKQSPSSPDTAVLEERVDQLQVRLESSVSEVTYLRSQVQAANNHVKLWSERASELKDLLQAQTENNQPVLAAFAASLEARAHRGDHTDMKVVTREVRA